MRDISIITKGKTSRMWHNCSVNVCNYLWNLFLSGRKYVLSKIALSCRSRSSKKVLLKGIQKESLIGWLISTFGDVTSHKGGMQNADFVTMETEVKLELRNFRIFVLFDNANYETSHSQRLISSTAFMAMRFKFKDAFLTSKRIKFYVQ